MAHPDLEGWGICLAPPHRRLRDPAIASWMADTATTALPRSRRRTVVADNPLGSSPPDRKEVLHHRGRSDHPTLRRTCRTRDDTTILHLDRSPQPALNVEKPPRAVRMMTTRLEQQLPIDAVEVALDVDIEHPVKPPAALTGLPEGIDRRSAGAVPIGVLMEAGLQDRLQVLFDDFLGNSVANRWNAQRPGPSIALGKVNPPHRWRKVAP